MRFILPKNLVLTFILIISFIFLFTSYIPHIYEASIAKLLPPDRKSIVGEHMYTYDYNVYLSKIRQGMEGRWSVVDKYDNNPDQRGVLLQMTYLLSGKIGGLFGFSPGITFHILRTVASFIWVITIIFICFYFLKKPLVAAIGVFLSLFAASWPVFYTFQGTTWVGMHMSWWQELDVLKRISYIPHYTLNYVIISILSLLLYLYSKKAKIPILNGVSSFFLTCVILFFSFFIHPSAGVLFLISWILFHLLNALWFRKHNRYQLIKIAYDTIFLFLVASLPLIYFQYVTSDYPWKSLIDFDKLYRYPVIVKDYILALGPIFFTGILGILLVLWKKESRLFSLVTWFAGAFIAILAFKKFPFQSELRFVQTANHIPLAILSTYFLFWLKDKLLELKAKILISNVWEPTPPKAEGRVHPEGSPRGGYPLMRNDVSSFLNVIIYIFIYGVVSSIILLGIVQSYFSIKSQTDFIHQRTVAAVPLVPRPPQVMYPLKDLFTIMEWLEKNTKNEEIVLSDIYSGNYIPAYSGNFIYLGHNPETPQFEERVKKLETFYSGSLTDTDALTFLKEQKISYVIYGPQEREKSVNGISQYSFLSPMVPLSYVTLYKVQ